MAGAKGGAGACSAQLAHGSCADRFGTRGLACRLRTLPASSLSPPPPLPSQLFVVHAPPGATTEPPTMWLCPAHPTTCAHPSCVQFTHQPHYTMCALVVVNAACNTALPLFIDRRGGEGRGCRRLWAQAPLGPTAPQCRLGLGSWPVRCRLCCARSHPAGSRDRAAKRAEKRPQAAQAPVWVLYPCRLLNPLAAILISVTAVLLFAEIAPQVRSCDRLSATGSGRSGH